MTATLSSVDPIESDVAGQVEMDRTVDLVRAGRAHPDAIHAVLLGVWERLGDPGLAGAARRVQAAIERAHEDSVFQTNTQKWTRGEQMRAGHLMRELGYVRKRSSKLNALGIRDWIYVKGDAGNNASPRANESGAKRASGDEQDVPL